MDQQPPSPIPAQTPNPPPQPRQEAGFYVAYAEFAKNLRVWFLAYGIGATAIFVTNEGAGKRLLASGSAELVTYLFLGGVVLQIFVALLYKSAMWYLYMGELDPEEKDTWMHGASDFVSNTYVIEFVCDLATVLCFGGATYQLIRVFIT